MASTRSQCSQSFSSTVRSSSALRTVSTCASGMSKTVSISRCSSTSSCTCKCSTRSTRESWSRQSGMYLQASSIIRCSFSCLSPRLLCKWHSQNWEEKRWSVLLSLKTRILFALQSELLRWLLGLLLSCFRSPSIQCWIKWIRSVRMEHQRRIQIRIQISSNDLLCSSNGSHRLCNKRKQGILKGNYKKPRIILLNWNNTNDFSSRHVNEPTWKLNQTVQSNHIQIIPCLFLRKSSTVWYITHIYITSIFKS